MMAGKFVLEISFEKISGLKAETAVCLGFLLTRYSTIQRFLDFTEIFRFCYDVDFVANFT